MRERGTHFYWTKKKKWTRNLDFYLTLTCIHIQWSKTDLKILKEYHMFMFCMLFTGHKTIVYKQFNKGEKEKLSQRAQLERRNDI